MYFLEMVIIISLLLVIIGLSQNRQCYPYSPAAGDTLQFIGPASR